MATNVPNSTSSNMDRFIPPHVMNQLQELMRESNDPLILHFLDNQTFAAPFLIGRKLNVRRAFETLKNYVYAKFIKHPKLFQIKPQSVRHVLESGLIGMLKNRDSLGRVVAFSRCCKLDNKTMDTEDIIRAGILLAESLWESGEDVNNGQVGITDNTGYSWAVMTKMTLRQKINMINLFWNICPMKIKGLHAVNSPRLATYAYSIIRPFLPRKVKERIFFHGSDLSSLHEHLSPEILPTWLGGKLSDEEAIDHDRIKRILESHD